MHRSNEMKQINKRQLMSHEKGMMNLLILYASFHGSTAQIAEFMGKSLSNQGISSSVKSIDEHIDFSLYNGIIMGAPIHRGKWMGEAIDFVNTHRLKFENMPFACFYTCIAKAKQPPSQKSLKVFESYQATLIKLFPTLPPSHIGSFAGMLEYDKCSFFVKLVLWLILRGKDIGEGDYRDWRAIESWLSETKKYIESKNNVENV